MRLKKNILLDYVPVGKYNQSEVIALKQDSKILDVRHKTVVKANDLIQKSRFSLSVQQQKIVLYLISQITQFDTEFKLYDF